MRLGQEPGLDEIVTLFGARGQNFAAVTQLADELRQEIVGDTVTWVHNRNINYTNVCTFKCKFCGFSKGPLSLNLRGTYAVSKTWDLTTGYAFERYRYSDIGYDGFSYTVAPITTSASYVSGQNALQNYTAQMVYLLGTFKF